MKNTNNTKKYFDAAAIADNFMEELKIAVNFMRIKENVELLTNFDMANVFEQLIKDSLLTDFSDEQLEKMADTLRNGYTTYLVPILNYENRERTPKYQKALKLVENSVSAKLNSQTAKEQFVAEETKLDDDTFEGCYGMSPEKFYDTARDLFNCVVNGKTFAQTNEQKSSEL